MKDKLKRKLCSNRGVTLLLSLLLFMVCAVAGSVLITAGTASAGTISERAKLDQRYFSVTSAAELLRKKFDGKSVTVTVAFDNAAGTRTSDDTPPTGGSAEEEFVIAQSLYLLDQLSTENHENIQWHTNYSQIIAAADAKLGKYTLTATEHNNILQTSVTVERPDPSESSCLTFTVKNANGDKKFRLKMEYSAGVVEEVGIDTITYQVKWKVGKVSMAY